MGCNCGGRKKMISMTSAEIAEQMQRDEIERRTAEVSAQQSSGEHRPLPRVVGLKR